MPSRIVRGWLYSHCGGFANSSDRRDDKWFFNRSFDISPILATLGMMITITGVSLVLTEGYVISGFSPAMLSIGNKAILGVPVPMLIFLSAAGLMALILNKTPLGTRIYLIGSNPVA